MIGIVWLSFIGASFKSLYLEEWLNVFFVYSYKEAY